METINLRPNHLLALSLLLAACDPTSDDSVGDDSAVGDGDDDSITDPIAVGEIEGVGQNQVPVAGPPPVVDCPAARFIGVLNNPSGSCSFRGALPPGWIWTGMFSEGTPGVDALTVSVPSDLQRFCMYEYSNGIPDKEATDDLFAVINNSGTMTLDSVASDCRGEFAQSDLLDPSLAFELHDAFRTNIDWIDALELGASQAARVRVDMTVVDTVSQLAADTNLQPANEHGLYMAALIGDIACPDGDLNCLENHRHTLAMPRDNWASGPDWDRGGQHGTQGDLALAVYEAVGGWVERRLANPSKASPRLVLNLSLGWQRVTVDANDPERGPAKSLTSALQYASCQGALVFVAAGNNPDEGCPEEHMGALIPAAFEELRAPTAIECAALGFSPAWANQYPVFGPPGSYMPLVHAVGGVDEFDRPLINARPKSHPRLAALGSNGITAFAGGSTEPLTGTSVSAAVYSGIATLLWSYRPELRPDEIVELIYASGWDLAQEADFGLIGGGQWDIHRASVCAALDKACDGQDPDKCPKLDCEAQAPANDGNMTRFFDQVDVLVDDPSTDLDKIITNLSGGVPVCEVFDWTNLADPQPEKPVCSRCNIVVPAGSIMSDDSVKMTTDLVYDGLVTSVSLITVDGAGTPTVITFGADVVASVNSPTSDVTLAYVHAPNTISASLVFGLVGGTTQSNSITVKKL